MNIGLVSTFMPPHPGGIEHVASNIFKGYQRSGHSVRWVTSRVPRCLPAREGDVVRVPCFNFVEDRLGVPLPVWGPAGFAALRALSAWADVIHVVEALYLPSAMAVVAGRMAGKPILLCQNVGFIPYRSRLLEWSEHLAYLTLGRFVLRSAAHLVLATPTADEFVRSLLGPALRDCSTFPIGIDTEAFRPATPAERRAARDALGVGTDRPLVLFAGRLVEKKGVPVVLGAAGRMPDVSFVVAGDGPQRSLMGGAAGNVTWLGQVDSTRMVALYHAADAVVLPSQGEGLPLFIQEAMACGVPSVISADEVYAKGLLEAGVCVGATRAPDAMSLGLRQALRADPVTRERVRDYAARHWGLDAMAERYVAIARALAGKAQEK
jgi:glycosyltransferase involved in cell wall biosynthesis